MPHSAILPDPRNGRRRPPLLLCCLLLLSGLLAASCVESSLPDGAVASVNGKTISLRLVQALMDSRSVDMGALEVSTPESMKNQYGEALGTLIIACLAEEELAERGQSVSEETVSREEKLIREDYEDEDLNAYLEREALDYEDWRQLLRVHLTMQAFERQVLLPGIRISVDEVRAYHAANVERFHVPEHMMLCFLAGEDKAQLEELVKGAKDDLASEDDDRIKAATERLSEESQKIFAKVYQQAAGAQGAQGGSDGTDGAAGDEEFHQ